MSTRQAANTKGEKLAQRLSCILALLHQGSPLNKHQLAERFDVDVRTIERDLHQRLHGIAERAPEGSWQLCHSARGTVPAHYLYDYARLAGTAALFPDASTPYLITQLETTPAARGLHVQAMPEEDLRLKSQAFAQLQQAVQQCRPCQFSYKGKPRHVHPYQLTHKNGIWYLAAAEVEGDWLKAFSVARIENLRVQENERFTRNRIHRSAARRKPPKSLCAYQPKWRITSPGATNCHTKTPGWIAMAACCSPRASITRSNYCPSCGIGCRTYESLPPLNRSKC